MLSQNTSRWEELILRWKLQITAGLIGLVLLVGGIVLSRINLSPTKVEIIDSSIQASSAQNEIVVEVSGEVKNPGVFHLSSGSRVEDALNAAGGLTDQADKTYLEKTINRAAKLVDGQKVYISSLDVSQNKRSEVLSANISSTGSEDNSTSNVQVQTSNSLININSASQKELESLWGIGPVTAQKIIEQRPYSETLELLSKKILKSNVYERIKNEISIY